MMKDYEDGCPLLSNVLNSSSAGFTEGHLRFFLERAQPDLPPEERRRISDVSEDVGLVRT